MINVVIGWAPVLNSCMFFTRTTPNPTWSVKYIWFWWWWYIILWNPKVQIHKLQIGLKDTCLKPLPYNLTIATALLIISAGQEHGDVRLANNISKLISGSRYITSGRLEIYFNNSWFTISTQNFNDIKADIACRQLNSTQRSRNAVITSTSESM